MTKKSHFIGIGGIGMSGLARLLLGRKEEVTGSDIASNYVTDGLIKEGAQVYIGHSAKYITPNTTVVYGSDIKKDNPEYLEALNLKCHLLHRSELLAELMSGYKALAVAGTHGKTTTSALLTAVLIEAKMDPSFAVGGVLPQLHSNAGHGNGPFFVAEADESDGTFLKYHPYGAIVTNIDLDHMNFYDSEAALVQAFQTFISQVSSPQSLFWCGDDTRLQKMNPLGISYGFSSACALKIINYEQQGWKIIFDAQFKGKTYKSLELPLVGRHNALNALAVFGLALSVGVEEAAIRKAFASFQGVLRRCEKKGDLYHILVLDDYGHHPTEIVTTLKGIREAVKERRLIAVYQPHRYSRTQDCLGTFSGVFDSVDELIVTDIHGAGESPIPGLNGEKVLADIQKNTLVPCRYLPRSQLLEGVASELRPHDVVVTIGAGDVTKIGGELIQRLKASPPKKIKVGLIFGGRSVEHEVSLVSAKNFVHSLKQDLYEVIYFGIAKDGTWRSYAAFDDNLKEVVSTGNQGMPMDSKIMEQLMSCDVLLPVLHGSFGEDGTIQGFFDILGKAYVGCDHRSAAIAMDKALTKNLMIFNGIATSPFITFSQHEWKISSERLKAQVLAQLKFPVFVKPTHLGSSIGVKKVETPEGLEEAIQQALQVDTHVLVENGIVGREIEFAVLGNDWVKTFPPGEILTEGKVYDYDGKYSANGMKVISRAELPQKLIEEGMNLAEWAYKAAGCMGMARVDFFLDREGKFWLNEINPIPGFTPISLYPQICNSNGLTTPDLVDWLLILGLQRQRAQRNYTSVH